MKTQADKIFYERESPRKFKDREIATEDLLSLFEAARWAASSFNEQPWRFVYGDKHDNSDIYDKLMECLNAGNQKWAKQAPVLMLTIAKTSFDHDGSFNRHALHDLGMAMGNFSMQAAKHGIMIHQMAGFSTHKANELFNLPEDYEPVAVVAIGYPDEEKDDRKRKPLDKIIINQVE
jgi:nitroreductase